MWQATASYKEIGDPVGWKEICAPCCPFLGDFSGKIKISYKLHRFGIKEKTSRNFAFLLLPWSDEWLVFPVVVEIMCRNWLNFLRGIPELLKESKEPYTIKKESHELCKLFPKVKGKHPSAHQRKAIAVRMLTVALANLTALNEQATLKPSVAADSKGWGMSNQDLP